MSKKIIVAALLAALSSTAAIAQDRHTRDHRWQQRHDNDTRAQRDRDTRAQRDRDARSEGGWGRTQDFNAGYDGAGPNHDLRRGQVLPRRYRNHQYVVDNWRLHRLSRPPRGFAWVQTGADYVLINTSSGSIARISFGH